MPEGRSPGATLEPYRTLQNYPLASGLPATVPKSLYCGIASLHPKQLASTMDGPVPMVKDCCQGKEKYERASYGLRGCKYLHILKVFQLTS